MMGTEQAHVKQKEMMPQKCGLKILWLPWMAERIDIQAQLEVYSE